MSFYHQERETIIAAADARIASLEDDREGVKQPQ